MAVLAILTLLAAVLFVSGTSFWIDEFGTSRIARAESFPAWWDRFIHWHDSDMQMPFYHGLMYFWSSAFGFSEYAHRLFNLPFLVVSLGVVLSTFGRMRGFAILMLVISMLHPLMVYYLDEARPYVMVYAGSMLTLCAIARLYASTYEIEGIAPYSGWLLTAGFVLLAGSSMLGTPWVVAAAAITAYLHVQNDQYGMRLIRDHWVAYSALTAGMIILVAFYLYTLSQGARAADAFQSNLLTLLFSGYELIGVSGLGPGRLDLRANGIDAVMEWIVPVAAGAVILAAGFIAGLRELQQRIGTRQLLILGSLTLLPAVLIATAGLLLSWRVLGRHFMPFLPVVVSILSLGIVSLLMSQKRHGQVLGGVVLLTIVVSGLSMMAPRHAKDDYQAAAQAGSDAITAGDIVWWAAYGLGADFYSLPINGIAVPGEQCREFTGSAPAAAYYVSNQRSHCLENIPDPDVIILSKPDTFDRRGAIRERIDALGLEQTNVLPAFTIWRKPDAGTPQH